MITLVYTLHLRTWSSSNWHLCEALQAPRLKPKEAIATITAFHGSLVAERLFSPQPSGIYGAYFPSSAIYFLSRHGAMLALV
jgi:hypothetical protein